jgi:hypothetical protein
MFLDLPADLVDRLPLEGAVRAEMERPRGMLPSRVVEKALEGHQGDYAQAIHARLRAGIEVVGQESVWAPKPGPLGRYRWLILIPIRERVLMRALVMDLGDDVPIPDRSTVAFNTFQAAPLAVEEHHYITVSDVASFYFYVDHQLLESRLVEASAKADTAEAIRAVLASMGNRSYGLPQNFAPSDALSEVYISWVERRLARAGVPTYRHNDDFRLGAATWGDALRSLERLGDELSAVGLELNGEKSWIVGRERYEANLRLADEIFEAAIPDNVPAVDSYTGEPIEPEGGPPSDEEMLAFGQAIFEMAAHARLSDERMTGFQLRANRELLNTGLAIFRNAKSDAALEQGPALVAVDPAFAQSYSRYLESLADVDEADETSRRVLDVVHRYGGHTPYWVQAWLINPLLAPRAQLNQDARTWLQRVLSGDAPSMLRGRAALALAAHKQIDVGELARLVNSFPSATAPDLVAAVGLLQSDETDARVRAVVGSEHLYRWIFDYAGANSDDRRWA